MKQVRIGIIGCGNISGIYFENLGSFKSTKVIACADLDETKAAEAASKNKGVKAMPIEELLDAVDVVVNLTIPHAHAEVAMRAIEAGKHVYNEKPLAIRRRDARTMLALAGERGVRVGCAPDTFLGAGLQTCRELIDSGTIGQPIAAQAFMTCHGHESWHPSPEFYYQPGGGPMFDMGPYYLTALVHLMGPVESVNGMARITFPTRTITSEPKQGNIIEVEVPTHVAGQLQFVSGAIGEITTSFDIWHAKLPHIAIYGTEGSMIVPDPNGFGGEIELRASGDKDWHKVESKRAFGQNSRGLGVLDMVHAVAENRPHRASGELAYHVLDIMHSIHDSSDKARRIKVRSSAAQPAALDPNEFKSEVKAPVA